MQDMESITVAALLARATMQLGPGQRSEAELLLCHALDRPRAWLFAHADGVVDAAALSRFELHVSNRMLGVPVAQIVGHKGFWSIDLQVTPDVLIPRAETELLVECALTALPLDVPTRVADLGTGSGAIGLAIAKERPHAQIVAVDANAAALRVARLNAQRLALSSRVHCVQADWLSAFDGGQFDAIASNPPYIAENDPHLDQGDLRFEPRMALASGTDGLDAIRVIVRGAPSCLCWGGWLVLEHGWEQGASVRSLLIERGFKEVVTHPDLEARERVTLGRWMP